MFKSTGKLKEENRDRENKVKILGDRRRQFVPTV